MDVRGVFNSLCKKIEEHFSFFIMIISGTVISFIVLVSFAMVAYPDGVTPSGLIYENYSFWGNFLSDLGMAVSFGNNSNTVAPLLFNSALIILAVGVLLLNLVFYTVFRGVKEDQEKFLHIGFVCGFLSPVFLVLIGVFPKDAYYTVHGAVASLFFLFALIWVLSFNALLVFYDESFKKYAYMGYLFWIISMIYTFVPIFLPQHSASESIFKPMFQKVTIISLIMVLWGDLQACRHVGKRLFEK